MNKKEHSTVYGWEWPKGLPTLLLCVVALIFLKMESFWLQPAVTDEECFLMLLEKLYGSVSYLNLFK